MLAEKPIDLSRLKGGQVDAQVLRLAVIAELDAISLYEQLAAVASSEEIKKVLLDVAKEEKTHVGEFLEMLLRVDKEQVEELEKGREEIKEILGEG